MASSSSSIGLYIGTESADLVQLAGSFQHPRLINYARVPLPSQSAWRSHIRAEEKETAIPGQNAPQSSAATLEQTEHNVAASLKSLFQKVGLTSAKAHTAITPEAVVIRYFQMPTIPAHERKVAVAFEAKKYLPFKLEELVTHSQVVIRRTDPTLMRIMFFGTKKTTLEAYLSMMQSAGCAPLSLEAVPVGLQRLVRQTGQLLPDQVAAILWLEKDTALISIASDRILYLSRNVTVMESPEARQAQEPAPELVEALINETRVSIDYYRRRFLGEPTVSKVILYGSPMDSKRVAELAGSLDIPVEVGEPFKRMALANKENVRGLAIAAGLALRGLEKRAGECNLLPAEHRHEFYSLAKPIALELGVAILLLGVAYFASGMDIASQEQKIATLKSMSVAAAGSVKPDATQPEGGVVSRPLTKATLPELQSFQSQQRQQLRFLKEASNPPVSYTALLSELVRSLPLETWLRYALLQDIVTPKEGASSLRLDQRNILKVAGASYAKDQAKEFEEINNLLAALRSSQVLKAIYRGFNLDTAQRGRFLEEDVTEFRLTCSSNPQESGK